MFKDAVNQTPALQNCLRNGLQALGPNSNKIQPANPRLLSGSVDLDTCLHDEYPQANRWDYALGYGDETQEKIYYVEVHPASTNNIKEVIAKKDWLDGWLKNSAPELHKLRQHSEFHWIASGSVHIPQNQYRRFAAKGIKGPASGLRVGFL